MLIYSHEYSYIYIINLSEKQAIKNTLGDPPAAGRLEWNACEHIAPLLFLMLYIRITT